MAKMLKAETKQWIVDTEDEATEMIDDFKSRQITDGYTVSKSGYTLKQKKSKGEVIDQHFVVEVKFTYE